MYFRSEIPSSRSAEAQESNERILFCIMLDYRLRLIVGVVTYNDPFLRRDGLRNDALNGALDKSLLIMSRCQEHVASDPLATYTLRTHSITPHFTSSYSESQTGCGSSLELNSPRRESAKDETSPIRSPKSAFLLTSI